MILLDVIRSESPEIRHQALAALCQGMSFDTLMAEQHALDRFRRESPNLYHRVRALLFLAAIHRFFLPGRSELPAEGRIPHEGVEKLLARRFDEAIRIFRGAAEEHGPSETLSSALAAAYHALAFQTLGDQVRSSVRSVAGNRWMFRTGAAEDHPLRIRPELLERGAGNAYPILRERTAVRMDLTHSCWSDIFFLGMDAPESARVLNVSIDLALHGAPGGPQPPIEACLRVIDEPVLRLVSVDLEAATDVRSVAELFDFGRDYLGLLKAAVIASGLIPPGFEGSHQDLATILGVLVGPGRGLELVSSVNNIPKGSRLAVSTNLLAGLIAVCMRATRQAKPLTGGLSEAERRLVAARAILGEWLGGSGGGWQDSGGVWPGIKVIEGQPAAEGDPEWGVSRGRLLPRHTILGEETVSRTARQQLEDSLVLVHGGMAQNVGPVLEMVTEKYLLRDAAEWKARQESLQILDRIVTALSAGDIRGLAVETTRNFTGPIQTIIPAATNAFTEALIEKTRTHFGDDFWGFWMLGGMSGGGMGFIVAPHRKADAQEFLQRTMTGLRHELRHSLPFAMDPVVYDFAVNPHGTTAELLPADEARLPRKYYTFQVPHWLRADPRGVSNARRAELASVARTARNDPAWAGFTESLWERLLPVAATEKSPSESLAGLLETLGFDRRQHERIRDDLRRGLIGLSQNRLPPTSVIEDVLPGDVTDTRGGIAREHTEAGLEALRRGEAAVVTLAAGVGSRWTQGAGVVKALHPFARLAGRHRSFFEAHLAKSRKTSRVAGVPVPHVYTTGYATHQPLADWCDRALNFADRTRVTLSPGRAVGLRLVPMVRDLRFAWEETNQQVLDERKQQMKVSQHAALIRWAESSGEGSDYTANEPLNCLHPVGHWYEIPNLLRNGVLRKLLADRPQLKHLMLHNIDTLGADLDPGLLGMHLASGRALNFEMIARRFEDRGGGLARVDGRVRILEGLALPREEEEFRLSYYNSLTTWIEIDGLLKLLGLTRADLADDATVAEAVNRLANRMPTYVTLKDVKRRWGRGQEDIFPVCQFEKLWGDLTALPDVSSGYFVVGRPRGQQLKDQAQLDGWLRDGSADYLLSLSDFEA